MDELIDFKKRFLKNGELVSIPKKESYKITYFLYKVRENDTYESIAKIFSVDAEDVKKINNYENLYPGKLVRLKK